MRPRPILKGLPSSSETTSNPLPFSSCPTMLDSPHVHFPPTPTLTSTEMTHSSFIYDRAPIVVTPNTCALPERGERKFIGSSSNIERGYFHPHAKFQVDALRVERDSSETPTSALFSASVTVSNANGGESAVGLFMRKRSGPMYDYDYDQYSSHDQHTQHAAQHVISSLMFDRSSESSDLGILCSPPTPYLPASSSSLSPSPSSLAHSAINFSAQDMYNTSTAPPPSSSTDGKRRRKSKDYTHNRDRGKDQRQRTMLMSRDSDSYDTSREFESEGCLGGF